MIEFVQGLTTGVALTFMFTLYLGYQQLKDHPEAAQLIKDKLKK